GDRRCGRPRRPCGKCRDQPTGGAGKIAGLARPADLSGRPGLLGKMEGQQGSDRCQRGTLSHAIFDTCPLLGCYFVAGSTTSNIINFAVGDIGATGWKLDVEVMIREHVQPMIGYARDAISDARLEVQGLERSKASVNDTTGLNYVNKFKKSMVTMVAARVPFVDDPNDYQAAAK